jgi:hypothetical protein
MERFCNNRGSKMKVILLRWGMLTVVLVILTLFVFELYVLIVQSEGDSPLPPLFGNFPRVRAILEKQPGKEEFLFAVVGDTQSTGTFERIVEELRKAPLDFAVLLGDCSYKGTESHHRYFRAECAEEYALPFPVFYVVGNHDVSVDEFPISRFEEVYGPSIFSFEYQGCLFLVLRILNKPFSNEESIEFLRSHLKREPGKYRKRFVFMHIPPRISPDFKARQFAESEELVTLLDELDIDYVFTGDYHGYARVRLGNTTYIVSGGGGGHLDHDFFPQFHHAVVLRVGKDFISERIIPVSRDNDFEDRLEKLAITEVYPWVSQNWVGALVLNAVMLLVLIGFVRALLKNARRVTA